MSVEGLDLTSIGILVGAIAAASLAVWQAMRNGSFDVATLGLNFLAVFGLIASCSLIWAAFRGDPSSLPTAWREYVAFAGVAGIGLALQHLVKTVGSLSSHTTSEDNPDYADALEES